MYDRGNLPWRDKADWDRESQENERALKLREELTEKIVSIHMAVSLKMEEEVVEGLIDNLWNPLREAIRNPDTEDLVLSIMLESLNGDAEYRTRRLLHEIGACGCDR